jgi:acyl-ACP thioesterase
MSYINFKVSKIKYRVNLPRYAARISHGACYARQAITGSQGVKALVSSLAYWINVNQEEIRASVSAIQYKMKAIIKFSQEEPKAAVISFWSKLEETFTKSPRSSHRQWRP